MKNRILLYVLSLYVFVNSGIKVAAQTLNTWEPLGPVDFPIDNVGSAGGIARTAEIKFHPKDPNTIYAVTPTGGIFVSSNAGQRWIPAGTDNITDKVSFGSICLDPNNDQVIYAGSGDPEYYDADKGLYKSTDGGKSWSRLSELGNRLIIEILMSPLNSNELIVATDDGIWKTLDGGYTWKVKKAGGAFTDMQFKAGKNTSTLYAVSFSEYYKSEDMGETWRNIPLPGDGISEGGRIGVSKADTNVVYLTFVGETDPAVPTVTPVLRSADGGESFSVVKPAGFPNLNGGGAPFDVSGQDNYDYAFTVDPLDINTLYCGGQGVYKSTDGGATWQQHSTYDHKMHTDYHQMVFSPYNDKALYNTNDGGIWVSTDGGETWDPLNDGLSGTQTYDAVQNPVRKDIFTIGTQDNGEYVHMGDKWYAIGGGDESTMYSYSYTQTPYRYRYRGSRKLVPTGNDTDLKFPFEPYDDDDNGDEVSMAFTPFDTNAAFLSRQNLYRTTNLSSNPPTWTKISFKDNSSVLVKALAIAPSDKNTLYVVTSDKHIYRSDNALDASPAFTMYDAPDATKGVVRMTLIKNDPNVIYLSTGTKLFRSKDKGQSWDTIQDPDKILGKYNILSLVHDHNSSDESIYVAKQDNIFYRNNVTNKWEAYSTGLPRSTYISKLEIFQGATAGESVLRAVTEGRGIFSAPLKGSTPLARNPENPLNAVTGLDYSYYTGDWDHLPNFISITPSNQGTATGFTISAVPGRTNNNFGLVFKGYIDIPAEGVYTFYIKSDDGSQLYIGDQLVVNNDGLHTANTEANGAIALKAGKHAISLGYFNRDAVNSLSLNIAGPGMSKQTIPGAMLYHLPAESLCAGTGSLSRELWHNTAIDGLSDIPFDEVPTIKDEVKEYFRNSNMDLNDFGQRIRGYICAPYDGDYIFYIACDDEAALYLSTDTSVQNKRLLVTFNKVTGLTGWYVNPQQKSFPVTLKAGQKYYIEVLHRDGNGEDYVSVAWQLPSGQFEGPIPGKRLSPYSAPPSAVDVNLVVPSEYLGKELVLKATAKAQGAKIVKVEFFQDGHKLGEDLSVPYTYTVQTPDIKTYRFSARAIDDKLRSGTSGVREVAVTDSLLKPANPASVTHGLAYRYYEIGKGDWYPNFDTAVPKDTGFIGSLDISVKQRDDFYSILYTGYLDIPRDGYYNFSLYASENAILEIGGQVYIYSDDPEVEYTKVGLKAGKHAIKVKYLHKDGGHYVHIFYSGPMIDKQEIPVSAFYKLSVYNQPPVVSIQSPQSKEGALTGSNVTIVPEATDVDGTIQKVELLVNGVVSASTTLPPYTFTLNNMKAGSYTFAVRATDNRNAVTVSATSKFYVLDAIPADAVAAVAPGLSYKLYNTSKSTPAPNLSSATYASKGTSNNFTYSQRGTRDEYFAIRTDGYIVVPADGVYTFYLLGDDSAAFTIGSQVFIKNNDTDKESTGRIGLKAGRHKVRLDYYQAKGDRGLQLSYSGPDIEKQEVPDYVLFHSVKTVAPFISITGPSSGAVHSIPVVYIETSVADSDGTIKKVEFYHDNVKLGESNNKPYDYTWQNMPSGNYTLTARAYDNSGAVTVSDSIKITVALQNQKPLVSMKVSEQEPFFSPAVFTLSAVAMDKDGTISKVAYYNGSAKIGETYTSPYYLQSKSLKAGLYTFTAVAFDNAGDSTISAPLALNVYKRGNIQPAVVLLTPDINEPHHAPLTLDFTVNVTDPDGTIQKVAYYDNDSLIKEVLNTPFSLEFNELYNGTHTFYAVAYDNAGESSVSNSKTVAVQETAPTVSIYQPDKFDTYYAPADIIISADARDQEGYVQLVEYYVNGLYIGRTEMNEDAPYFHYEWDNVPAGTYSVRVIAYDDLGLATYSDPITVVVSTRGTAMTDAGREGISSAEASSAPGLFIAPNPAEDVINITAKKEVLSVTVSSQFGQIVYSYNGIAQGETIHFGETLPGGMYYVTVIYSDNTSGTYKLIKN